jgi:hypothetical protein
VSGKMKVMLQRAEDALFLSSRTFATKSAHRFTRGIAKTLREIGAIADVPPYYSMRA